MIFCTEKSAKNNIRASQTGNEKVTVKSDLLIHGGLIFFGHLHKSPCRPAQMAFFRISKHKRPGLIGLQRNIDDPD
jgi:hypothetical protein